MKSAASIGGLIIIIIIIIICCLPFQRAPLIFGVADPSLLGKHPETRIR